jgi:hypothetical protein
MNKAFSAVYVPDKSGKPFDGPFLAALGFLLGIILIVFGL